MHWSCDTQLHQCIQVMHPATAIGRTAPCTGREGGCCGVPSIRHLTAESANTRQ